MELSARDRDAFDLWRRLARDTEACQALSYHHRKTAGDFGDAMAGSVQAQATLGGIHVQRFPSFPFLKHLDYALLAPDYTVLALS